MKRKKININPILVVLNKKIKRKNFPTNDKKGGKPAKVKNKNTKTLNVKGSWVSALKFDVILNKETSIKNKIEKNATRLKTYV